MSNKLFTFLNISPEDEAKIPQGIKDSIRLMEGIEAVYEKAVPEKKEMFARMLTVGYAEIMRGINNVRGINTEIHEKIKEAQKELPEEKHPPQGPEPQEPKEPEPKEPKPEEPENSDSIFYNPAFAVGEPVIGISAVATEGAQPYFIDKLFNSNIKKTGGYPQPINGPEVPEGYISSAYKLIDGKGQFTATFLGINLAGVGDTIAYNIKGFPAVLCEIKNIQCNEKGKFTIVYEIKGEGTFTWSEEELKRNSIEAESFYVIKRRGALRHYMPTVPPVLKNALGDLYIGENIAHITSNDIVVHERIRNGSETDTVGGLFPFRKDGPSLRNFSCYTYNSKSVYRQAAWATGDIITLSASGNEFVYIRILQVPANISEPIYYENSWGDIIQSNFKELNTLVEITTSAYLVQMRPDSYRLFPETPEPPKPEPPKPEPEKPDSDKPDLTSELKEDEEVLVFNGDTNRLNYGIATSEIIYSQPTSKFIVQFPINGPSIEYDGTIISQEIGFKDEEGEVGDFEYFNRATVIAVGDILYYQGFISKSGLHLHIIDINSEADYIDVQEYNLSKGKPKKKSYTDRYSIAGFYEMFIGQSKDKLYILKTRTQNPDWPYKSIPEPKPAPKQKQKKEPKTEDLKNKVKSVNLDEFNNLLNEIEF